MRLASILALSTVLTAACGTASPTVPVEPVNATAKGTEHEGMDHGDMKGMDHGDMKGMDHGDMKGMDHGDMKGMDHGDMKGMDHGDMKGMDHGAMKGAYACPMHPDVTSDHAGECPKCGMALVEKDQEGHDHADGSDEGNEAH